MVWPALLIGVAGLIGIQLALGLSRNPKPSPSWLTLLSVVLIQWKENSRHPGVVEVNYSLRHSRYPHQISDPLINGRRL